MTDLFKQWHEEDMVEEGMRQAEEEIEAMMRLEGWVPADERTGHDDTCATPIEGQ